MVGAVIVIAMDADSKTSEAVTDICQELMDIIGPCAVENGVSVASLRGQHTQETGPKSADMLLGVDDLLAFRMKTHGRIGRLAYDHGLWGSVSASAVRYCSLNYAGF